jgi:shikimate dehydrogenase
MKRFGVIGHPIGHSLSPLMHNTAYEQLGLDCRYEAYDVEPASLADTLRDFAASGFSGLNVTIPHKEQVATLMDTLGEEAKAVGAVNTIVFDKGTLRGENTDVYGVEASLASCRSSFDNERVLVLGAGGASRAIMYALLTRFTPSEIVVANRRHERAEELVRHFAPRAGAVALKSSPADFDTLRTLAGEARLIVNATSTGMSPAVDASPLGGVSRFHPDQVVFDLIYTPLETKLLATAAVGGARTISGLEMFLHQGARSFDFWLSAEMPVDRLRPIIERELRIRQYNQTR